MTTETNSSTPGAAFSGQTSPAEGATLRAYVRIARRRKFLLIGVFLATILLALAYSLTQQKLFQATAQVLLNRQDIASTLSGSTSNLASEDADRQAETQVNVASVPEVVRGAVDLARQSAPVTPADINRRTVTADVAADVLYFRVVNASPGRAQLLSTTFARSYIDYRRRLDTASISRARRDVSGRLAQLQAEGRRGSSLFAILSGKEQQLATLEALQGSNASLIGPAHKVLQVQPRIKRNLAMAFVLGLVLAFGATLLREALDTRVRTAEEVGRILGAPLLVRLPPPAARLRSKNRLLMQESPTDFQAEGFRMLRTSIKFAQLDHQIKSLLVTSATATEGKSTTIANLAIAFALAGQRVILVDLDLRKPFLHKFFDLQGRAGLSEVVLGEAALDDALCRIPLPQSGSSGKGARTGLTQGSLEVLISGAAPPDPGEFIGTQRVASLLHELSERCDMLLLDAAPVLAVGDALTLSSAVDGMIVVARMDAVRRGTLGELRRVLRSAPTSVVGCVITGADATDPYGDGRYGGYGYGYATSSAS